MHIERHLARMVSLAVILSLLTPAAQGGAILFDQTTDTISVAGTSIPIGTSSTYEARVFFSNTFQGFGVIFNKWTNGLEDKDLRAGPTQLYGFNFPINLPFTPTVSLTLNAWHHIAFVYDGSQERFYLDGSLVASRTASGDVADSTGPAFVGAISRIAVSLSFVGYLDTLRISNVARYSGSSFTPPAGDLTSDANTLLLYNFNESPSSTTVADLSANGHTGTLGAGNFAGATSPEFVTDPAVPPPPVSGCTISGSSGVNGVLDSALFPANTASAFIGMDTGEIFYFDLGGNQLGSPACLPGLSCPQPVPNGEFHFESVRVTPGVEVSFFTDTSGLRPPVLVLACEDIVVESGGALSWGFVIGGPGALPAGFLGAAGGPGSQLGVTPNGFGPRSGSLPAPGSLYPALGGGGGNGGAGFAPGGIPTQGPDGGRGGPAFVIASGQRIRIDGMIFASGVDAEAAPAGSTIAQGGAGGSLRLAAVLVEGTGTLNTSGGADSDGVVRSPSGPSEIQAFVKDLFTGAATTTPTRNRPVVAPVPDNLPIITVGQIGTLFDLPNTGSLTTPDFTFPVATSPVTMPVMVFTEGVPGTVTLAFRAVGSDGSVSTATQLVQTCPSAPGQGLTCADLTFQPGVAYQVVVTPSAAFSLARPKPGPFLTAEQRVPAEGKNAAAVARAESGSAPEPSADSSSLERWEKAFGVRPDASPQMARLSPEP